MRRALVLVIVFVCLQLGIGSLVPALWRLATSSPDITEWQLITSMFVSDVVILIVFLAARWAVLSRSYLKSKPVMALLFSAFTAIGMILPAEWVMEYIPDLPNSLEWQFDSILRHPAGYVVVGLLAPLVEEVVFRGAILRSLLHGSVRVGGGEIKWYSRPWTAITLSALLFSLIHLNPAQMPYAFAIGMLLGWMYLRTDSIIPGVVYHWMNNTVAYILYNIMPGSEARIIDLFSGSASRLAMALVCSLLILIPSLLQLNIWLKKA